MEHGTKLPIASNSYEDQFFFVLKNEFQTQVWISNAALEDGLESPTVGGGASLHCACICEGVIVSPHNKVPVVSGRLKDAGGKAQKLNNCFFLVSPCR